MAPHAFGARLSYVTQLEPMREAYIGNVAFSVVSDAMYDDSMYWN
jgi:hypothetical protein